MTTNPALSGICDLDASLRSLASSPGLTDFLAPSPSSRITAGYGHTLAEICQQPLLWPDTARRIEANRGRLAPLLRDAAWIVITGSGSSHYAADCVHPVLRAELGVPAYSAGGGWLLIEGARGLPSAEAGLVISLARSGDSPESVAVVEQCLAVAPSTRHLVITCNAGGALATRFAADERVSVLTLDPRSNDRSLVMTSSFTDLVLAARGLALLSRPAALERMAGALSGAGRLILSEHCATIRAVAEGAFRRAVFLASGCRFGAARESALKMLEMNAGQIPTMAETYLELRHGPMALLNPETLAVCFLSSDPLVRAYEEDLICELRRKETGARLLLVGEPVPASLAAGADVLLEIPGLAKLGDDNVAVLDAMVGQLLAFFRCAAAGLRPDLPSTGAISRVVNEFPIHHRRPKGA